MELPANPSPSAQLLLVTPTRNAPLPPTDALAPAGAGPSAMGPSVHMLAAVVLSKNDAPEKSALSGRGGPGSAKSTLFQGTLSSGGAPA